MFLGFLLPLLFGWLLFDVLRRLRFSGDVREIILVEAILLGVGITVSTECLNALHFLTTGGVFIWWILSSVALNYYRQRLPAAEPLKLFSGSWKHLRESGIFAGIMLIAIFCFTAVLLFVAILAAPNNYDSMTYHLARVGHWVQDQSIAFYGTSIPRQNYMPPWSSWAMLQLVLLQGDDRLVNLVQWLSYSGCILGASLVTERLGGTRRLGILAAFFVASLPMAIFESTTTQNDLVMSFWLICVVYACIQLSLLAKGTASTPACRLWVCVFGAGVGLAIATKVVTLLFAFPLCLWCLWATGRQGLRQALPHFALITVLVFSLNAGHAARNILTSGHLMGPEERDAVGSHYGNDVHNPGAIFSNILRNASLHANVLHHKSGAEEAVVASHRALGIDPQDPHTTFNSTAYSIWEGGEDGSPMPIHLVVIALAFIGVAWSWRRIGALPCFLALSVLAGALLFCTLLKWSPFHARPHLALFILAAPVAALALGQIYWRGFSFLVVALMLLDGTPDVLWYWPRAAVGPLSVAITPDDFQQLFRQPQLVRAFSEAREILVKENVKEVGLIWREDEWEYPFHVLGRTPAPWRVEHVLIENAYTPLETKIVPDALLCSRKGMPEKLTVHGRDFHMVRSYVQGPASELILSVYLPDQPASEVPQPH